MATPAPPRVMPITIFAMIQNDSGKRPQAAFRSHPNERGMERAEAESVLCLCGCAFAAVVRARLRTALIERHLAIVDPLFVARLAAEPLLGGAGRPGPNVVARVRWRRYQRHREHHGQRADPSCEQGR